MKFGETIRQLEERLRHPLPGEAAQARLAPRPKRQWPSGFNPDRVRHAAGLLLLYPNDGQATVILTLRADSLDRHGGQVSLPGGAVEIGESYEQAALREAHEEIALDPSLVRTIGQLSSVDIPVSGFRLHPIVAVTSRRPSLHPADGEVARVLDVSLGQLMDPEAVTWRTRTRDAQVIEIPAFSVADIEIWGATAMVLAELLALLGWPEHPARG